MFLDSLRSAWPAWVDWSQLADRLPGASPRQMARFVDTLEDAGLALVSYRTKTRGPYALAVPPDEISLDGKPGKAGPALPGTGQDSDPAAYRTAGLLETYCSEAWVAWALALFQASLAFHEGMLSGADGMLARLDSAQAAAAGLPTWAASVVEARRAQALGRQSRYREASFCLRRLETAAREGRVHPGIATFAGMLKARMRHDQGRCAEAERLLAQMPPVRSFATQHLNLIALLAGKKALTAPSQEAAALLAQALSDLVSALGYVFLCQGDMSVLDPLCFNLGNSLFRGVRRGLLPAACVDTATQWLLANRQVCRKLGVGGDSVMAELRLIDIGLRHGNDIERWPVPLRQGLNAGVNLEQLVQATLVQARKAGNRLEIAEALKRLMRVAERQETAGAAYFESVDLFGEAGQARSRVALARQWEARFGKPPPTVPRRSRKT